MNISFSKIIKYLLAIGIIVLGFLLFTPKSYDVPQFKPRKNVNYWDLKSGSKIGYSFLKGIGEVQKSPIIYLHGGPGGMVKSSAIDLLRPLTEYGFDIYLYDQVGSGHSNRLEDIEQYSVERHKNDLGEIIELIGAKKVILFGHSWGTLLAVDYFAEHQDKVDKIIFSGPGPMLPFNRKLRSILPPDSLNLIEPKFTPRAANKKMASLRSKMIDLWANIAGRKLASDEEVDQYFTALNSELSKSTSCDGSMNIKTESGLGYYSHIMTVKSFYSVANKRAKIKDNQTPLLILRGQCDNQKWGHTQEYLSLFKNSNLKIIESAGHSIPVERQSEYIKYILEFLSREITKN